MNKYFVHFRQAIERLMSITPLNESIDLKDHYLAFIELENFGVFFELDGLVINLPRFTPLTPRC